MSSPENHYIMAAETNEKDDGPTRCLRTSENPALGGHQAANLDFDYTMLPIEIRAEARIAAVEIKSLMHRTVIEVGNALARIKRRLPHGQFGKWLSAEFGLTERSAQNYIRAAALVSKYETVSV